MNMKDLPKVKGGVLTVIEAGMYDLSCVGGPMGSDHDDLIETRLFTDEDKAIDWAYKTIVRYWGGKERLPDNFLKLSNKKKKQELGDIGPCGFQFAKKKVM